MGVQRAVRAEAAIVRCNREAPELPKSHIPDKEIGNTIAALSLQRSDMIMEKMKRVRR